jgi:hypothetical protein
MRTAGSGATGRRAVLVDARARNRQERGDVVGGEERFGERGGGGRDLRVIVHVGKGERAVSPASGAGAAGRTRAIL